MTIQPQQKQQTPSAPVSSPAIEPQLIKRTDNLRVWRRFRANRAAVVGLVFIILVILAAIGADLISPYSPTEIFPGMRGKSPSWEHWLGFDQVGRDLLSRVIYGARAALLVGVLSTVIAVVIGVAIGSLAGYFGGWVDQILSRIVDTLMAFPTLALLITLAAVLGQSLVMTIVAIGATIWAAYARVVRADVMSLRERDFVLSARASGASDLRIIFFHILPNVMGPVIVLASLGVGSTIILESALSFLGLGIRPPAPSWGSMLADARAFIVTYPHIMIAPGVMIVLTVLAFNLLGDGLRDAFDPRQKE